MIKFKSKNQEHIVRSLIASVIAVVLVSRMNDTSLLQYIVGDKAVAQIAGVILAILVFWLAFGKLYTKKTSFDSN